MHKARIDRSAGLNSREQEAKIIIGQQLAARVLFRRRLEAAPGAAANAGETLEQFQLCRSLSLTLQGRGTHRSDQNG